MKTLVWLTKYYPIIANVNIVILMALALIGVDLNGITGYIVGCTLWSSATYFCLSFYLHFCAWHRWLLGNTIIFAILAIMEKCGLRIDFLPYVVILSTISCIIVATILYWSHGCFKVTTQSPKVDRYGFGMRGIRKTANRGQRGSNKNINNVLL